MKQKSPAECRPRRAFRWPRRLRVRGQFPGYAMGSSADALASSPVFTATTADWDTRLLGAAAVATVSAETVSVYCPGLTASLVHVLLLTTFSSLTTGPSGPSRPTKSV